MPGAYALVRVNGTGSRLPVPFGMLDFVATEEEHTMSALAVESGPNHGSDWDRAVHIWEQTDAPEGCKVEIIEGIVTVAPQPVHGHAKTVRRLQQQLDRHQLPDGLEVFQNIALAVPARSGMYVPDLVVTAESALDDSGTYIPATAAELVVEVTSKSNANYDRIDKLHGYATAGVPLYLLLDRWHSGLPTAMLFGEPEGGTYRVLETVKYGEGIHLPEPFDLTIDTGAFPVPPLR